MVAEWVDAQLVRQPHQLLGALRRRAFRASRGIRQVALKPSEFQQLQILRERAEQPRALVGTRPRHAARAGHILPPHT